MSDKENNIARGCEVTMSRRSYIHPKHHVISMDSVDLICGSNDGEVGAESGGFGDFDDND